jgi:hypothetical protein
MDRVRKIKLKFGMITAVTALLFLGMLTIGCKGNMPKHPVGVPAKATPIAIPHGYDWDYCWVDKTTDVNRCQIFNGNGVLMYDGIFLRYEGTGTIPEESLRISQKGGEEWVELQDGDILIPKSDYEQIKRVIDWLKGRRKTP